MTTTPSSPPATHRYCVIMCGGVGSRFWPFSRERRPKQFLDFFGTGRSLLQMTADRARRLVSADHIYIVTNELYAPLVAEQLPEIPPENILLEPCRRNTAPCVCWAAHHICARDARAVIATFPADHLILREDAFLDAMEGGMRFAETRDSLLTLGIRPSHPHTGYGYIQAGTKVKGAADIMRVKSFTEKPDMDMARLFVQSGEFFWNSGIFIWSAQSILKAFSKFAPEIAQVFDAGNETYDTPEEQEFIEEAFPQAPSISIDYAVMEKADNVFVMTVDFGWSDLGSWKALYESSPHNREGNVTQNCKVIAEDCTGCVFASEGDKIIVASGLHDYIVANSDNAVLIYPMEDEQKVRRVANEVRERFGDKFI